ncbi:MAG: complex I NDUFA9 subunit family protein [Gammaproteobacteria bacterium]
MIVKKICILGGTGFVGQTLANRLSRDGYALKLLTRNREAHKDNLILLPKLDLVETNVHDADNLVKEFKDCDAVINLVGILNEQGSDGSGFSKVHVELTEKILAACRLHGIRRYLHMSALNADIDGPSHYLRSKAMAENLAHAADGMLVTSFQPSVIFGAADSFFNRFATLLKLSPVLPLACPEARFSPVFVNDVAEAFVHTLKDPAYYGKRLQLCGPQTFTLRELVQYTAKCIDVKRLVVPLPDTLSRIQAKVFDLTGFIFSLVNIEKPFSTDNYLSLQTDSVCHLNALEELGIRATAIDSVVPQYLSFSSSKSRYYSYRQHSGRNS